MGTEISNMSEKYYLMIDRYKNTVKIPCVVWDSFYHTLTPEIRNEIINPTMRQHKTMADLITVVREYVRGKRW